jgi:pimeloyl-ACP methyl ester carboxylesterase
MKKIRFVFCFLLYCSFGVAQKSTIPANFKYCLLPGLQDSVYEGYIDVYENRITNHGKKISLYVIIVPAIHKTSKPPLFYIDGGPGVAATNSIGFYAMKDNPYRQNSDVVLIDVRGTGKSNPLNCPSLQTQESLQNHFNEMYPVAAVKNCYDQLSKTNDLTQYHTTNVVHDLEEVRKQLGYQQISLFGLSYGTRVCLQYMRMYQQSVSSVVLWAPVYTYARIPLYHAKFGQDALEMIWQDCKNDKNCNGAYPNIKNEFNQLMQRWKQKPLVYELHDSAAGKQSLIIPWHAFQTKLRSLMYAPGSIRSIPYLVHEAFKGNLTPFIDLYPKGKSSNNFIAEGFYLCVTCTEDVPFIPKNEIESLTASTFMGTYRIDQQQQACANWTKGIIPSDFLQPVSSSVPTLIMTGSFDPVTPPSMAKEIAKTLANSQLIEIPYMSHVFDGLSNEQCFDHLIIEFLNNPVKKLVDKECIKKMLPPVYKTSK